MKKLLLIITIISSLILSGCTEITAPSEETVPVQAAVTEPADYPVTVDNLIFNSSPLTVGSLSPAVTEIIFELGFGDRIICKSSYCDYPEEAQTIPQAGSAANPDFDKIIEYAPSLLITQSPIANKDVTRLGEAGITVMLIPAPSSVEELYGIYSHIALIFAGQNKSAEITENALADFKDAYKSAENSCESLAFIMNVTDDGFSAATGDSFAGDYIKIFGKNAADENTGLSMTWDELLEADPQVLFLAHPLNSESIDYEVSSQLRAFNEGHVYVIDASLMERPTSRLGGITRSISKKLREDAG